MFFAYNVSRTTFRVQRFAYNVSRTTMTKNVKYPRPRALLGVTGKAK
jgi:hypothetical protein